MTDFSNSKEQNNSANIFRQSSKDVLGAITSKVRKVAVEEKPLKAENITEPMFSQILQDAMRMANVGPIKLEELLRDEGIKNISFKRISEYTNMVSTPGLEKAKDLMRVLGYEIDEQKLISSLVKNREWIREEKANLVHKDSSYKQIITHIKLRRINKGEDNLETERKIIERIKDLNNQNQGKEKIDITRYIEKLIEKDINSKGVRK